MASGPSTAPAGKRVLSDDEWVFRPPSSWKSHTVDELPRDVRTFVEEQRRLCQPTNLYICNGTPEENDLIVDFMIKLGMAVKLNKLEKW